MIKYLTLFQIFIFLCLYPGLMTTSCQADTQPAPKSHFPRDKWVYLTNFMGSDSEFQKAKEIALEAKQHGLNGIVLAGGLDSVTIWKSDRLENLRNFKSYCDEIGIEIIPQIFSAGYGGAVLTFNPNLAAVLPFVNVPFTVRGGIGTADVRKGNIIENSGFENPGTKSGAPSGFQFLEKINDIIFIDKSVKHTGQVSLRLENFNRNPYGHARIVKVLNLKPYSEYEFSCWIKTDSITPLDSLEVKVFQTDMKRILPSDYFSAKPKQTQDWTKFRFRFKTIEQDSGRLYIGTWGAKSGKVWLDDLEVVEISPARDLVRRPGTPISVKSADRDVTFEEGADFEKIPGLTNAYQETPQIEIRLTPNSRIKDGEKLLVSGYSIARLRKFGGQQISICMSEDEVYKIWAEQADVLYQILKMKKAFLSMDEIRAGGACKACKDRNMSMAQILGDCITRQMKILRANDPKMEIYCWGDMLDPNANAHDNYYLVDGSFDGSWNYVPKDLIMVAWVYQKRIESLQFFSKLGFSVMGAPYYDKKSLDDTKEWYLELAKTPGSIGIMYTTWKNDYSFLSEFGDYVKSMSK